MKDFFVNNQTEIFYFMIGAGTMALINYFIAAFAEWIYDRRTK